MECRYRRIHVAGISDRRGVRGRRCREDPGRLTILLDGESSGAGFVDRPRWPGRSGPSSMMRGETQTMHAGGSDQSLMHLRVAFALCAAVIVLVRLQA
jgi:hypothetical protein